MAVTNVENFLWVPVRDAIRDELLQIDDIKIVLPFMPTGTRMRNSQNRSRFKEKFVPDGQDIINAWAIMRTGQSRVNFTNHEQIVTHQVSLHFWYEANDEEETQDAFDTIVDNVHMNLQAAIRLGNKVELQGPAQMPTEDFREFAGELCHHVEITTTAQHRVFVTKFR